MRERRKLAHTGMVALALTIDKKGHLLSGPDIRGVGLAETEDYPIDDFLDDLADAAENAFDGLSKKERRDPDAIEEVLRRAVRREADRIWGKKPVVEVIVLAG